MNKKQAITALLALAVMLPFLLISEATFLKSQAPLLGQCLAGALVVAVSLELPLRPQGCWLKLLSILVGAGIGAILIGILGMAVAFGITSDVYEKTHRVAIPAYRLWLGADAFFAACGAAFMLRTRRTPLRHDY